MVVPHPLLQPFLETYSVTVVLKGPPPGSSKKFSPLLLVLQKSRKTPNDWQFIHVFLFTVGFIHLFRGFPENFWSNSSTFTLSHRWLSRACYFSISYTPDLQPIPQSSNQYPRPPTNSLRRNSFHLGVFGMPGGMQGYVRVLEGIR